VILELGGKDALVVCDDAELEAAAHAALNGAFIAAGQNCLAAERILVMDGIYDRFVKRVTELARGLRQDVPTNRPGQVDVGALVTPQQLEIVEHLVSDAIAKGARALVGGKRANKPGNYFEPTVLVDVRPEMAVAQEEAFGPVLSILRVKDDADAVRVANSTAYGLGCTVFSKDAARAKRIADRIQSGSASINDFGFTYMAQDLPFGGVGGSGFGRLNGREGLRACCHAKAVLEDRVALHAPGPLGARAGAQGSRGHREQAAASPLSARSTARGPRCPESSITSWSAGDPRAASSRPSSRASSPMRECSCSKRATTRASTPRPSTPIATRKRS
jgi:acyl-CoA reductase-like NAD-dependent aldehyde dehydrogenase